MPAFSFTAPTFTSEDLLREKESMDDREAKMVMGDIYGEGISENAGVGACAANATLDPTGYDSDQDQDQYNKDSLKVLVDQTLNYIDNDLEDDVKENYLRALQKCPNVVHQESNLVNFLHAVEYDIQQAATRICLYWDVRIRLFDDTAFFPLTILPGKESALKPQDIKLMEEYPQYMSILRHPDHHGRLLLYSARDGHDLLKFGRYSLVRVAWYMLHHAANNYKCYFQDDQHTHNEKNTAPPVVIISNLTQYRQHTQFDRIQMKFLVKSLIECAPVRVKALHVITGGSLVASMLLRFILVFVGRWLRLRMVQHDVHNAVDELEQTYGISTDTIPSQMGGKHVLNGVEFLRKQRDLERRERERE